MFAVYQHDVTGHSVGDLLPDSSTGFTRALAIEVVDRTESLDTIIDRHAQGWDVDRIAPLDRAILRVAIHEMTAPDGDDHSRISPEGAIDEAVETAKQFCSADTAGFVNGILGSVLDEEVRR